MKIKNNNQLSRFLFSLSVLVFVGILYVSFKDFFLTPTELFETAQKAEYAGNFNRAEKYYLIALGADDENIEKLSAYYLGNLYKKGNDTFPQNMRRAEMFLTQASNLSLPQAQYDLALLYDVGDKIPEDKENAKRLMQLAADQNYPDAIYALAVWHERGYFGEVDDEKVLNLYTQAANQNHVQAITGLIARYSIGTPEAPAQKEKAIHWMNKLSLLTKGQRKEK